MTANTAPATVSTRDWLAVIGAMLGAFMAVLDIQITNSSLKDIQGALGASLDEGTWISTGYLIAEIVVIPLTGWLSGVFSLRRYLLVNAGLFLVFSVLCGMAGTLNQMIVFRVLQGFSGGVLIPAAFTILITKLPPSKRPIGAAMFGLTATFAPAIGPTLGGWLTDNFGWQTIFYINVIPGLILMGFVAAGLDKTVMRLDRLRSGDWLGVATMAVGLGSLEYVLEEGQRLDWFGSPEIVRLAALSAGMLVAFVVIQLTRNEPLINLRLLGQRTLGSASAVNLITGLALYGSVYLLPVYLGQIQGYNAQQIGEVIMWLGMPQLFILPLVPKIMARTGPRPLIAFGLALFAVSCFMNGFMSHDTAADQLHWSQLVRALGQPFIMVPLSSVATVGIIPAQAAQASALFNIMRNLGGSLGIALLSTFVTVREHFHFAMIADRISANSPRTQDWLAHSAQRLLGQSGDGAYAQWQAAAKLAGLVRRDAFVMAYSDGFFAVGIALTLSIAFVALLAKSTSAGGGGH